VVEIPEDCDDLESIRTGDQSDLSAIALDIEPILPKLLITGPVPFRPKKRPFFKNVDNAAGG